MRDITVNPTVVVEVSAVENMHFPDVEVLFLEEERTIRERQIILAHRNLGSEIPMQVVFEDIAGTKKVYAPILDVEKSAVVLAGEKRIPIKRIIEIKDLKD